MRATRIVILLLALAVPANADRVDDLLAKMTLEEKLGQLIQYAGNQENLKDLAAKGMVSSVLGPGTAQETNELQKLAVETSRLGIPILFANDVIHGFRTIFPIPLGIASTWDPGCAETTARIGAREARAAGTRWTFAPMVDIARDPRWGRIAEGAGEDPYLGSAMAAAYVRGSQGANLKSDESILACAKHFVAYGAAQAGRDYHTTDMSEATLREVYLPPFQAAVSGGVWTFMSAFNALNGVPSTANRDTLKTILRDEWKFNGFVVSDWTAIAELIPHGVAATPHEAAMKAIQAGVDMDMVDASYLTLADAVKDGRLPMTVIDDAVRRILRAKLAVDLFDRPYTDEKREASIQLAKEHLAEARRVAQKSIVLLKNDGALLPLAKDVKKLALIGPLADSKDDMLGSWRARGRSEEAVSLLEGIRARGVEVLHAKGVEILEGSDVGINEALGVAKQADIVLLALGEAAGMSGEAASRVSLDLPGRQQELLERVVAVGKPVVLVVLSGRPLTIRWAAEHVPAIVWGWFPGSQGGHALADVIFGDVNPSGKLPVTFPRSVGQIPIYYSVLPTGRPMTKEKYTSKYLDSPNTPLYPFGHGLSYTKFEYSDLRVNAGDAIVVSATVRNSGARAGEEIVQLYVNDPVASVSRPVKELKGFTRVSLAPGESKRVAFTMPRDALRFWASGRWVVEPGNFRVWVGPSSAAGLEGSFEFR